MALVGFVQFKRLGTAKGEIQIEGSLIKLKMEARLNQIVELLYTASLVLFGFIVIGTMTQDFRAV